MIAAYDPLDLAQRGMRVLRQADRASATAYLARWPDPWQWMLECVITQDQADRQRPFKRFPRRDYLQYAVGRMTTDRLLLVSKSRRMLMTWTAASIDLWEAMHPGRWVFVVSEKEEKSAEVVERCKLIHERLRVPEGSPAPPRVESHKGNKGLVTRLDFPDLQSRIWGMASGSSQLRQYTASLIHLEEFALWPDAEEFWASALPTLQGAGDSRIIAISTPHPGFMETLIYGQEGWGGGLARQVREESSAA